MENQVQIFTNEEFGEVRTITVDGVVWFVAVDVCRALELSNVTVALERLKENERAKFNLGRSPIHGGGGETNCVNEPGLYRLVFASRKPEAEKFQNWVYHEVLPSIRKTGEYKTPEKISEIFNNPDAIIKICQEQKAALAEKEHLREIVDLQAVEIAELTPKANYYDLILQSKEALPVSVIAKDYGYSARKFNNLLRQMRIQFKLKSGSWLVYQDYAKEGYTCTKTFQLEDGTARTHTYWTPKGRAFLYEQLKRRGIIPLIEQDGEED